MNQFLLDLPSSYIPVGQILKPPSKINDLLQTEGDPVDDRAWTRAHFSLLQT